MIHTDSYDATPAADIPEPYVERFHINSATSSVSVEAIAPRCLTDSVPASRPRSSTTSEVEVVVGPRISDVLTVGPRTSGGAGIFSRVWSLTSRRSSSRSNRSPRLQNGVTAASLVAPTILEASLLHGITTQTLLHRGAIAFRSQEFNIEAHYSKSFEAEHLGDFISHEWASSRWGKLLALGLVYNTKAAMVASFISSVAMLLLQYGPDPILPTPRFEALDKQVRDDDVASNRAMHYGFWNTLISPMVFLLFFLFWQDLRPLMRLAPKTCFLDKYCIDQGNPERKAAGILGLAGFLRCSDQLIILWTPRYFSRLWCTYEVASWLYLKKPVSSVLFMPLAHADIIAWLWIVGTSGYLVLALLMPLFPHYYPHIIFCALYMANFLLSHKARRSAMHLRVMKDQLTKFEITRSECFCCRSDHIMPTGEPIPCDRKVVYATIAEWFNDPNDDDSVTQEVRLGRFDQAVRKRFAEQVLQKVGPSQVPYRYIIIGGWPFFMRQFDFLVACRVLGVNYTFNVLIIYFSFPIMIMPLWYKFMIIRLTCWVDHHIGIPKSRVLDLFVSAGLALFVLSMVAAGLAPWELVLIFNVSPFVMLSIAIVVGLINCWVYPDFKECSADLIECCSGIVACFCNWRCARRCCFAASKPKPKPRESHEGERSVEEDDAETERNSERGGKECPSQNENEQDPDGVSSIFSC